MRATSTSVRARARALTGYVRMHAYKCVCAARAQFAERASNCANSFCSNSSNTARAPERCVHLRALIVLQNVDERFGEGSRAPMVRASTRVLLVHAIHRGQWRHLSALTGGWLAGCRRRPTPRARVRVTAEDTFRVRATPQTFSPRSASVRRRPGDSNSDSNSGSNSNSDKVCFLMLRWW